MGFLRDRPLLRKLSGQEEGRHYENISGINFHHQEKRAEVVRGRLASYAVEPVSMVNVRTGVRSTYAIDSSLATIAFLERVTAHYDPASQELMVYKE